MNLPFLRQILISAAILLTATGALTVGGSADVFFGSEGTLPTAFAEAEDAEEDHREDLFVQVVTFVEEGVLHCWDLSLGSVIADLPIACAAHHERGPPLLCI